MMPQPALVTVYITNYNYGDYVKQAIDSLLEQSYSNIEIYIIDDGSTDDSKEIILDYEELENVRIIFQKNKGLNATNNVALKLARGKYIMRLDADDYLAPNAIEKLVEAIESDSEIALVFPDYFNVDKHGEPLNQVQRHNFDANVSLLDQPAHGACTLISVDILRKVGGYDEEFTRQDGYDLWLKISHLYTVRNVNEPLFFYRQHGKSITDNESTLLAARGAIKAKHVKTRNLDKSNVLAIIPVRGGELDARSSPLRKLGSKELINWSIDHALEVEEINHLIVTTPSQKIIEYVDEEYRDERVLTYNRGVNLSRINQKIDDTILDAIEKYSQEHARPDLIMILYIEAPFRGKQYIQEAIDTLKLYELNSVEAVRPDTSIFYVHDGTGLKYLAENSDLQLERDEIYKRVGGMHLMRRDELEKQRKIQFERTGHIILDQVSSLFIRSTDDWDYANFIASKQDQLK